MKMKQMPLVVALMFASGPAWSASPQCVQLLPTLTSVSDVTINNLMEAAIRPGSQQKSARKQLLEILALDDMNLNYFLNLYQKDRRNRSGAENLAVQLAPSKNRLVAFPVGTRTTPAEVNAQFKYVNYEQIKKEFDGRYARETVYESLDLQAGTGSSMVRKDYLTKLFGAAGSRMKIGAKGTDLFIKIDHPLKPGTKVQISIAEFKLLRAYTLAKKGVYGGVIIRDIVGPETQNRLAEIWKKESLIDPKLTWAQLFDKTPGLTRAEPIVQWHVPAVNEAGQISTNRKAPPGHGFFGDLSIRRFRSPTKLEGVGERQHLVRGISNGEDPNSQPDPVIIDWIVKNRVPITLLTTTKTPIDVKGGILTLVKDTATGEFYVKVFETAEAKAAGQQTQFEKADGIASTNMTLFNHEVLAEKLSRMTEEQINQAMAPDLISNWKEQKDTDGQTRKYMQLEGALGSVIMNLDRAYRSHFGEPLVAVVNIEANRRTDFFSPIKSGFDFFMQFHSDRFTMDAKEMKLRNLGPSELPFVSLKDPATKDQYYAEVQNVLESFENASIRELKDLQVTGQVMLKNTILKGKVVLTNETGQMMDLSQVRGLLPVSGGRPVLENVEIRWNVQGAFEVIRL